MMFKIAYINKAQADSLVGVEWAPDSYFVPVKVDDNSYFIGKEEIDGCVNPDCMWVKDLPLSDYP